MNAKNQKQYEYERSEKGIKNRLVRNARNRAEKAGQEFNITEDDITLPEFCPVLGVKLVKGDGKRVDASYTLDRKYNHRGYIPGNLIIMSALANTMKNSSSPEDRVKFALWVLRTHKNTSSKYKAELQEALDAILIDDVSTTKAVEHPQA